MKLFTYTGTQPYNATLRVDDNGKKVTKDVRLSQGDTAQLDETHASIKSLINRGLLVESKAPDQSAANNTTSPAKNKA